MVRPGKLDRSPTGTGCSALMAVLHAKGRMESGATFTGRSIIETRFDCRIVGGNRLGRAGPPLSRRFRGGHQFSRNPTTDARSRGIPFQEGYRIADTWPSVRPRQSQTKSVSKSSLQRVNLRRRGVARRRCRLPSVADMAPRGHV